MFGFLYKNDKYWLVYDWDVAKIDYCIDQLEAHVWSKQKPEKISFVNEEFYVYWRPQNYNLPVLDKKRKQDEDVTQQFKEYIANKARYKEITDKLLGIRQEVLKTHGVAKQWMFIYFFRLIEKKVTGDEFKGKEKAGFIMLKELLDWNIRLEKYKIKVWQEEKSMSIGHNYEFELFNKTVYLPWNYTNALRQSFFKENVNTVRPDTEMSWLLQTRQYDVLMRMGHVTAFTIPRRWGKSFLLSYIALKEIIKNSYSIQSRFRPISVLYLWLTAVKNYSIVQYMKKMVKQMGMWATAMFDWNPTMKSFEFKSGKEVIGSIKFLSVNEEDPGIGDYADLIIVDEAHKVPRAVVEWLMPIVQNEWAKLVCASTLYPDLPKNWFYDLVVKWETCVFNIENEVENMYNENEDLIKRIYDWKYSDQDLQDYSIMVEKRTNMNYNVGLRYTFDDIEYIPDRRKDKIKQEEYEKNPRKFLISFYSRFPDEGKVFDFETSLKQSADVTDAPYKYIILWYDPALTKDYSALKVMWYNAYTKKLADIEEYELKKTGRYEDQAEEITRIRKSVEKYLADKDGAERNVFLVMDWTQKANAEVMEMKWLRIDCKVSYSAWQNISTRTNISGEHIVPKKYLVELFQEILDNKKIYINKELTRTTTEMSNFKTRLMASGYVKYEADTGLKDDEWRTVNDDFVNATLLANYFACNVLWLKYYMFREDLGFVPAENSKLTRAELAKYHREVGLEKKLRYEKELKKNEETEYYKKFIY